MSVAPPIVMGARLVVVVLWRLFECEWEQTK